MSVDLRNYIYILFKPFNKVYKLDNSIIRSHIPLKFLAEYQYDIIRENIDGIYELEEKNENSFTISIKDILPRFFFSSKYNKDIVDDFLKVEVFVKVKKNKYNIETEQSTLIKPSKGNLELLNMLFDNYLEIYRSPFGEEFLKFEDNKNEFYEISSIDNTIYNIKNNELINKDGLLEILFNINQNIYNNLRLLSAYFGTEFYTSNDFFHIELSGLGMLSDKFKNIPYVFVEEFPKFKITSKDIINFNDANYFKILRDEKSIKKYYIKRNFI